jgi:large subunit ribosomal protein L10
MKLFWSSPSAGTYLLWEGDNGKDGGKEMNQDVLKSKQNVVSEIEDKFKNSSSTVVAEYRGLSVAEITELRRSLRAEGVDMKIYKNTLASKAADNVGYGDLKNVLTGPNALAFGSDETAAARVMAKFAKKHKALVLKGGVVEGKVIDEATINELSKLPNREGMLSMLLSVLNAPVSSFARVVKAVADAKPADGNGTEAKQEEAPAEEKPAEEAAA